MTNEKPKRKVFKKIGRFFSSLLNLPIVRGAIKSVPMGNLIYEIAQNRAAARDPEKIKDKLPHSAVSIMVQLVFLCLIIYAFATKQITIEDIMNYFVPDDFKVFGPAAQPVLTDSIPA